MMTETQNSVNGTRSSKKDYDNNVVENKVFPVTFLVLKAAGGWIPTKITFFPVLLFYQFYVVFSFISVVILIISLLLHNALSEGQSIQSLMEYWYMLVIWSNGLMKVINLFYRRDKIIHMLRERIMGERWGIPRDDEELSILKKSEYSEKKVTIFWFTMIFVNWFTMILVNILSAISNPITRNNPHHELIFRCYPPCNQNVATCFWISFGYQTFGYWIISIIHVGFDCLIFNFIERFSTHLKMLHYRLIQLPILIQQKTNQEGYNLMYEKTCVKQCIKDHLSIYKSVEEFNNTFYVMVCIQFLSSISVLCTNIFLLSKQDLFSVTFFAVFAYLCCTMTQNFFYCWYGYKVSKSNFDVIDAIFNMDWLVLSKESRKMFFFVMLSASNEVNLFNNAVVSLTPEMFLKILKMSYSAFNLLQQSYKSK